MQRQFRQANCSVLTLLIITGVVGAVSAGAASYYVSNTRTACDRAAIRDISRAGAALERFRTELVAQNGEEFVADLFDLRRLVGPHYGWTGTNRKCRVKVKQFGNEVHACAERGSHATSVADERHVYRIVLSSGAELPTTTGVCRGNSYGGRGGLCYTSSMVDARGRMREPVGQVACPSVTRHM